MAIDPIRDATDNHNEHAERHEIETVLDEVPAPSSAPRPDGDPDEEGDSDEDTDEDGDDDSDEA